MTDSSDPRYEMLQHGCFVRASMFGMDNEMVCADNYDAHAFHDLLTR